MPEPCRHCLASAKTAPQALEALHALNNQLIPCEHCAHQAIMHVVADQFRMGMPQWWVVDGAVVVPIWIVELFKNHRELSVTPVRMHGGHH